MSNISTRVAFALTVAGAMTLGCASTRTLGTQYSDELATREIEMRLAAAPDASAYDVDVKVFRGKAVLLGEVEDERARDAAVEIASNVTGVSEVEDELKVLGVPRETPFDEDPDFLYASRINTMLMADGQVRGRDIDVEVIDGVVYLTGIVRSEQEKKRAAEIAQNVRGVDQIRNLLDVDAVRS